MFLDNSASNLASVNLMKFRREDGTFNVARFQTVCRLLVIAQEILVDHTSYPTRAIAVNRHRYRPIGLLLHQAESSPTMEELHVWLDRQFPERRVERNSGLGGTISYLLKHWDKPTLFLRVAGRRWTTTSASGP